MSYPEDSLRMVLIGRSGVGTSASGNTILMEKVFESSTCADSVTKVCQRGTGKVQGQTLVVVDTPGLFDTELSNEQVKVEIAKCIAYATPGPHVFLIILRPDRFTREEEETVKMLQKLFGEQAARYTMALFTRGDDLEADGYTIERVIDQNKALRAFLHRCKGGYHVFNNKNKDPAQVHELLEKINAMVARNGGSYYTSEANTEAKERDVPLAAIGKGVGAVIGGGVGAALGGVAGAAVGVAVGAAAGEAVGEVAEKAIK